MSFPTSAEMGSCSPWHQYRWDSSMSCAQDLLLSLVCLDIAYALSQEAFRL